MRHPKGTRARVLFTSVFGPYAQDDEFGSREHQSDGAVSQPGDARAGAVLAAHVPPVVGHPDDPAEHLGAHHACWTFRRAKRFAQELTAHDYDIVGISSIIVNVGKVREMCRMVRELSPRSTIVVGGHVTAIPGIERMVDADHIVRGDGDRLDARVPRRGPDAPIRASRDRFRLRCAHARVMKLPSPPRAAPAATIIPSVGCPMGCNFCTTSAFFGGKGKYLNFYDTRRGTVSRDVRDGGEARA